jgi:hypothetical protein
MDWLIFAGIATLLLAAAYVAHRKGWIDMSNKSRSSGNSSVVGIGDEVFHPTRHEAQIELDRQTVLPAPAPIPGDGDLGVYDGQVRIELGPSKDTSQ